MRIALAPQVVVSLAAALVASLGTARAAPVNGGSIRVAANYHPGGANAEEQQRIATTHDLIVLGTGWADEGPPATCRGPFASAT